MLPILDEVMNKFKLFSLLFIWICTLMTPAVLTFIDDSETISMVMDLTEEEQQKKGEKNQFEEKIINDGNPNIALLSLIDNSEKEDFYILSHFDHVVEIQLPPPEALF